MVLGSLFGFMILYRLPTVWLGWTLCATEITTFGRKMVSHAGGWEFADSFHELSKHIVPFNQKVH